MGLCRRVLRPVAEQILLSRMPMEIEIKLDPPQRSLLDILTELTQSRNLRKHILIKPIKLPIQIFPTIASPKIPSNNTIRVQHRHNIEDKHRT